MPMPADALLACFVVLPWVRLEARPFHIPPHIALLGLSVTVTEQRGWLGTSLYGRAAVTDFVVIS